MRTFAGIDTKYADPNKAKVILQSIPYDGTSTWGKGADMGFSAMLDAAENMELYDIETESEVYTHGIHIPEEWNGFESPEKMFQQVYFKTLDLFSTGQFLTFFGGEHSISIGLIKAFYENYDNLSVLHIDAHADLRSEYGGTKYNHACAVYDASKNCNLVQVGIRSMDSSEKEHMNMDQVYFAHDMHYDIEWVDRALADLTDNVYITLDLDVLDPSIMPATGTPEPGGMDWYTLTHFLSLVFSHRNVVGFDMVELAPIEGLRAPQFLAAKLYYKMLSYKFSK